MALMPAIHQASALGLLAMPAGFRRTGLGRFRASRECMGRRLVTEASGSSQQRQIESSWSSCAHAIQRVAGDGKSRPCDVGRLPDFADPVTL